MKAYKGFNKDMTCRNFQYKECCEYETDKAKVCGCGFHACENPIDCLNCGVVMYWKCELAWAQTPYEAKEGGAS